MVQSPGTESNALATLLFDTAWKQVDAGSRMGLALIDAQGALCRPLIDAQAEWLNLWLSSWSWPGPAACFMRGAEHLA